MDQGEIVAYRAIVSVDLRELAHHNRRWAIISIHEGKNGYDKSGRQEGYPLAYLRPKTVQTMWGSSEILVEGKALWNYTKKKEGEAANS